MKKRELLVRQDDLGDGKVLRVTVSYQLGGINYWTYKTDARGYWMHVQPMRISRGDGYATQHYTPTDGFRFLLTEASRFSQSGLEKARAAAEGLVAEDTALRDRMAVAAATLEQGVRA